MNPETKSCQNCKKDFNIEPEDFKFYEKMQVPPPTWCPECRMIRRFSFVNIRTLYKRSCDLCGASIISMFHRDKKLKVYCNPCWWGDSWDGTEYGMNYDPSRSFFEQMKELQSKSPYMALECTYTTNINTPYTNYTAWQKNSYLTYFGDYVENSLYSTILAHIRNKKVSGEYVYQSKNAHDVYIGVGVEDSRSVQFLTLPKTKDAYDYTGWGNNSEKLYECCVVGEGASNCRFCSECFSNARNLEYCIYAA